MLGTIVNVTAIIIGTIIGCCIKNFMCEKYEKAVFDVLGLCAMGIGINSIVTNMNNSEYHVLFIISLAVGSLIGTYFDIDEKVKRLSNKTEKNSIDPLVNAVLLFCIGTLAILGPIEAALNNNYTLLFTNASLDFVSSIAFAAVSGPIIIVAAVILFCTQGSIYLLAGFLAPLLSVSAMCELSIVGGFLILTSGFNILNIKKFKTLNMLPALVVSIVLTTLLAYLF